ncbi:MAG: UDP-3-O-(3-hydroxymyristoyl)glucosamine N-acyltransferase [Planctomycetes bacterium]|nr:UDP-3-O-(3-hydroxymyristoyl)glucosamine N-acyltransferase [Planctomycetota bacterium]
MTSTILKAHMTKTLSELAAHVGGEVIGDGGLVIHGVRPIGDATEGYITFVSNERYVRKLRTTQASAVIVPPQHKDIGKPVIVTPNPYLAFARILRLFAAEPEPRSTGVHPSAVVSPSAKLGQDVRLYPFAFVGDHAVVGDRVTLHPGAYVGHGCQIGDDTVVHANAVIYDGCQVGKRCVIHANASIGNSGLGYAPDPAAGAGRFWYPIPQMGIAVLEDDVAIGPGCSVNRGALGNTIIRRGAKIGGHVVVAHNVEIGEDTIIVDQTGVAGTAKIGKRVTLAGQVAIAGHIEIGDRVTVGGQSGVHQNLPPGGTWLGTPAVPIDQTRKVWAILPRLPELRDTIRSLERKVADLEAKLAALSARNDPSK